MLNVCTSKARLVAVLLAGLCFPLHAMDRWTALSQIESGDDDTATGPGGEVSRYQMKPDVWQHYAPAHADWTNPQDSLTVAKSVMQDRCDSFQHDFHRAPSDFEFYVLWNAPAQISRPSKTVSERANRFCNLISTHPPRSSVAQRSQLAFPPGTPPFRQL